MTDPAYHREGHAVAYHPILNTIANVVTAICAVAIAVKIY